MDLQKIRQRWSIWPNWRWPAPRDVECDVPPRSHKSVPQHPQALRPVPPHIVGRMAEWSDLVFAIDSIPVVLSVSRDPFVVFTSNAFAIPGLRSLYFAIAGLLDRCRNLHYGLAALLGFAGVKMLLSGIMPAAPSVSLAVILMIIFCIGLTFRRGAVQIHQVTG